MTRPGGNREQDRREFSMQLEKPNLIGKPNLTENHIHKSRRESNTKDQIFVRSRPPLHKMTRLFVIRVHIVGHAAEAWHSVREGSLL